MKIFLDHTILKKLVIGTSNELIETLESNLKKNEELYTSAYSLILLQEQHNLFNEKEHYKLFRTLFTDIFPLKPEDLSTSENLLREYKISYSSILELSICLNNQIDVMITSVNELTLQKLINTQLFT